MSPDVVVIGAGIVGLAVARRLSHDGAIVLVLDKERAVASHQSGRNSGVLHTGVYYAPGSAKAVNCRAGYASMLRYAQEFGIKHELCGKVIVATDESELGRLDDLETRAEANGVRAKRIDREQLAEIEPHAAGVSALHVPDAGIIDYRAVAESFANEVELVGGEVRLAHRVDELSRERGRWRLNWTGGSVEAPVVVNCAGLHSDRVARLSGQEVKHQIVPFRGEYYRDEGIGAAPVPRADLSRSRPRVSLPRRALHPDD